MADKKHPALSKIDALYSWLSYDLKKMKSELLGELKYASVQSGALYQEIKADREKSSQAISQEIRYSYKQNQTIYDGLENLLNEEVSSRLQSIDENASALKQAQEKIEEAVAEITQSVSALENVDVEALSDAVKEKIAQLMPSVQDSLDELKYGYMQQQAIYDSLATLISGEVIAKLDDTKAKLAMLDQVDVALTQIEEKLAELITLYEDNEYKTVIENVAEKTEECVAEHSRQVLDAVASIPVAENVDYSRIVDEVGDKVLELLSEVILPEPEDKPVKAIVDYDKIVYGTAEKVVESLPYPEKVDYRRIEDSFARNAEKVTVQVTEESIANAVSEAVAKAMASFDMDAFASAVAQKIVAPAPATTEIDYDLLSDMVAEKLSAGSDETYDVVLDESGINQIAEKVSEKLNLAELKVETPAPTYELVLDDEGIEAIANKVAELLCVRCADCSVVEEVVETVEEVVEETPVVEEVAETVEEVVEETPVVEEVVETVEEVVEETPVVEETSATEELAVAQAEEQTEDEQLISQLVNAEDGLVIRLKRSFTAKMKQSEDKVKQYYSDVKNELKSYKRINSNVSWHGDRFNFGRDTVAKMNICGKTLCFYLALNPEDEELKQTVYHQKDVGAQKAYESTPFMVKIKSDAGVKKALRLVNYLATKLGTEKEDGFQAVDYVEEYAYQSTKQLFDEGYIKATKEKKVELDF